MSLFPDVPDAGPIDANLEPLIGEELVALMKEFNISARAREAVEGDIGIWIEIVNVYPYKRDVKGYRRAGKALLFESLEEPGLDKVLQQCIDSTLDFIDQATGTGTDTDKE